MITAVIIKDSISPGGVRLLTLQLRYPKFIHGELMTHRLFSRNASSSRAIPIMRYIEEAESDDLRVTPSSWGSNQKGMVAGAELTGEALRYAQGWWKEQALHAAAEARQLMIDMNALDLGATPHKQLINRTLEPYIHINTVVTATEWRNFFGLRLSPTAQPEIQALAREMFLAIRRSESAPVALGNWHLPYLSAADHQELDRDEERIKVAVARVARVSYKSYKTGRASALDEDIALYDQLFADRHMSPFEHVATPGELHPDGLWLYAEEFGNFHGWRQHRQMIPGQACAPLPAGYELPENLR